jgi:hypothetical protein
LPQPRPSSDYQSHAAEKKKKLHTRDLIRKANVTALLTLRVWQVDIVLGQKLLVTMQFIKVWWVAALLGLGEAV